MDSEKQRNHEHEIHLWPGMLEEGKLPVFMNAEFGTRNAEWIQEFGVI
jgi:hypothetical protein